MLKFLINGGNRLIPPLHCSSTPHWYSSSQIISPRKLNLAFNYLTNSLGLSPDQAISTAHKLRGFKSKENFISVLDFFKRSGFNDAQIKSIVFSFPGVLSINVAKTLEPKIRVLEGLGLTPDETIKFVSSPSQFLKRSLESSILPVIETMRSILGSDENVARALRRLGSSGRFPLPRSIRDNVELLRSRGMSHGEMEKSISELALKSGVDYYMKELGYHPKLIAAHPALLSYSMEKRVRPRNAVLQVLKDKNLIKESFGLYTSLVSSESEFLERFVKPFKESVPDIYEVYKNYMRIPSKAELICTHDILSEFASVSLAYVSL
ncbi:Transcription termination factor MTERF9, chloroplastic-like protein, partial [Drosera capensis]